MAQTTFKQTVGCAGIGLHMAGGLGEGDESDILGGEEGADPDKRTGG